MRADWSRRAVVHAETGADCLCTRCGELIEPGDPCAWVPGLDSRGPAHPTCLPADGVVDLGGQFEPD